MAGPPTRTERLERLADRQEIEDVVLRYCRGVDRMDRELVRRCYHADATDEHGSFRGSVAEFLDWVFPLLAKYTSTFHLVGNVLVEFGEPGLAAVETYGIAFHRSEREAPHLNLISGFRYVDRFERRPVDGRPQWRIATRTTVVEWSRVDERAGWWPTPEDVRTGRRDRSDVVYEVLRRIG